ncbi:MATE family efflux transporter, partial [Stenotrophomonas sp. SrG]|uniref:MATE family efflux transporter n=1 Tax=Stenotrophomonas sp. SrG TaxID=3414430 RepID=UPI003CFB2793
MMWIQALCFAGYLWKTKRFAHFELFSHLDLPRWAAIWDLLRTGLPIGITVLMECGLFIVTALLIGRLGATEAASHQIAIIVAQLCFMIPIGLAEST